MGVVKRQAGTGRSDVRSAVEGIRSTVRQVKLQEAVTGVLACGAVRTLDTGAVGPSHVRRVIHGCTQLPYNL